METLSEETIAPCKTHTHAHRSQRVLQLSCALCCGAFLLHNFVEVPSLFISGTAAAVAPAPSLVRFLEDDPNQSLVRGVSHEDSAPALQYDFSLPVPLAAPVGDDFFANSVFIGDSRTDGFRMFSGLPHGDFLAYRSLMVYHVTGTGGTAIQSIPLNGTGATAPILSYLDLKEYDNVYVMFGMNDLGYSSDNSFYRAFSTLVDEIRVRQPNANIYIQSILPVAPSKVKSWWINNPSIDRYNDILQRVSLEKEVYYLDIQSVFRDEHGNLPLDASTDGIHFTREWYTLWYDYLRDHTIIADVTASPNPAPNLIGE